MNTIPNMSTESHKNRNSIVAMVENCSSFLLCNFAQFLKKFIFKNAALRIRIYKQSTGQSKLGQILSFLQGVLTKFFLIF